MVWESPKKVFNAWLISAWSMERNTWAFQMQKEIIYIQDAQQIVKDIDQEVVRIEKIFGFRIWFP